MPSGKGRLQNIISRECRPQQGASAELGDVWRVACVLLITKELHASERGCRAPPTGFLFASRHMTKCNNKRLTGIKTRRAAYYGVAAYY